MLNATVTAQSRLTTRRAVPRYHPQDRDRRVGGAARDVARVELGRKATLRSARFNGHPAAGLADLAGARRRCAEDRRGGEGRGRRTRRKTFPHGYKVAYPRDSTDFIKLSVDEVEKTLVEAIILVVIVMFVFLQNWRATLIPAIAMPVVLLGTFGVLALFGYSINTLTLFGMVLAIGLLVDDAIVVVENVERVMEEEQALRRMTRPSSRWARSRAR